ncbi:MAG: Asp23/Gls24 family envelope stress response protein [Clostridia bacterium]|nr:Asp23/Gls24 family envelope stress response protein [Clostridia bacterium]
MDENHFENNENQENTENTNTEVTQNEEIAVVPENGEEQVETVNSIKIANDAVAMYVGIAVAEIPGVYGMSGTLAGITEAISGKKNYTKGVKVDINEKSVKIDVNIIVEYGARIPDVAFEIQTKVKKSVETMTGLKVSDINVNVQGVHAITEKEEGKEEE